MNLAFRILSLTQASRLDTVTNTNTYEIDNEYGITDSEVGNEINCLYGFVVFQLR
jgi:hypothetical protein